MAHSVARPARRPAPARRTAARRPSRVAVLVPRVVAILGLLLVATGIATYGGVLSLGKADAEVRVTATRPIPYDPYFRR